MVRVDFFTAVSFGNQPKSCSQSVLETVDSYFYLGGKKACVIQGQAQQGNEGATLQDDSTSCFTTTIKVISYATVILPTIMLIAKIVLRSIHTFHLIQAPRPQRQSDSLNGSLPPAVENRSDSQPALINAVNPVSDAQSKLEEGVDISQDTITKIQQLMPKILHGENDVEIRWHHRGVNLVFSLASIPGLIFKMAFPGTMIIRAGLSFNARQLSDTRFANMIKAKEVCLTHQLGLLIIPHARKLVIEGNTLIAEEYVDICQNYSAQEELYRTSNLNETARQLAVFIAKTGFSDVEWRNMPIVQEALDEQAPRKVALVDLEEMDGAASGFFGGAFGRRGLVRCLHSEEQIDIALAEARRYGVVDPCRSPDRSPEQVKAKRMQEIQSDQQLQQFYMRNGILENARKPVQVDDLGSLGLNLDEQELIWVREIGTDGNQTSEWQKKPIPLRQAVKDIIAQINKVISKTPEDASTKGKRCIFLDLSDESLYNYHYAGLPKGKLFFTEKEREQRWPRRIINALVAKGHLFKLDDVNDDGYFIQA